MPESTAVELETVLEGSDDELTADLPSVLPEAAENPEDVLTSSPAAFRDLTERMATLEGVDEFAAEEPETVEAFLTLVWDGLGLISETIEDVQDAVAQEFSISWECTDVDVAWHMETDPDAGTIDGGPGELEGAELVFQGDADVLFSMLGDPDFDGTQAFMQGEFQIDGPIPKAQQLNQVMESAIDELDPDAF